MKKIKPCNYNFSKSCNYNFSDNIKFNIKLLKNRISIILVSFLFLLLFSCSQKNTPIADAPKLDSQQAKMAAATKELGEAFMAEGNYTAALNEFIKAEKMIPNDPYLHNDLGLVYMAKKRFDLAEKNFEKAAALNPDYIPAKNNLGTAYLKQGKWDLAIKFFKEISDNLLYATPHYPLSNLGWAYLGKKDLKSAKENFSAALEAQPGFINAVHGLATVYIEENNLQSAFDLLNEGIKKNGEKTSGAAILYFDIARVFEKNREFDKAKIHWQKVIELASGSPLADEAAQKINQYKNP